MVRSSLGLVSPAAGAGEHLHTTMQERISQTQNTQVTAPEINLLPTPANPGAPQDPGGPPRPSSPGLLWETFGVSMQSSAKPCASISLCRHFKQIFNDLQRVGSAWTGLISDDLVPLQFLSRKWRDGKSLASSNSHLDIAGTEDNEGF